MWCQQARGVIIKQSDTTGGSGFGGRLRQWITERGQRQDLKTTEQTELLPNVETSQARVDALDYNGFWKLFDGLTDAAFYGKNREYALGNTPEQISLGIWSDGQPVKPLVVVKNP